MARRSEFIEHVVELLRAFGPVEAKSMFGGWGLYHDGRFFAIVAEDTLYFKVDGETLARFEREGGGPFVYRARDGEHVGMGYHRPPDEALESPEVMAEWARLGYAAALRAGARKGAKAKAPRRRGKR